MAKGTINLGLVKAIHEGLNPPLNKKMIWYDENVFKHKAYNPLTQTWDLIGTGGGGGTSVLPVFTSAWQVQQPNNPNQSNGMNVAVGDKIEDFIKAIFRKASAAVYTQPSASIASAPANGTFEMGTTLSGLVLTGGFTKNDGGNATAHRIYKNGVLLVSAQTATETIQLTPTNVVSYRYQADYGIGPVKNNSLGEPDPTGQIQAGTVSSPVMTFQGTYKRFFGAQISGFTDFRNLSYVFDNTSNTWTLNTGTVYKDYYILIPSSRTLTSVVDLDALGLVITSSFVASIVQIPDASGALSTYKLYKMSSAVPYASNHRFQITIS